MNIGKNGIIDSSEFLEYNKVNTFKQYAELPPTNWGTAYGTSTINDNIIEFTQTHEKYGVCYVKSMIDKYISNHYYLMTMWTYFENVNNPYFSANSSCLTLKDSYMPTTQGKWEKSWYYCVCNGNFNNYEQCQWGCQGTITQNVVRWKGKYPQIFDVTEILGSGKEPDTGIKFAESLGYKTVEDIPYFSYDVTGKEIMDIGNITKFNNEYISTYNIKEI